MIRTRKGSALLAVLFFSAVVLMVAGASISTVIFQNRMAGRSLAYKQAMGLAEAGAERALAELNTGSGQWTGWTASGADRILSNQSVTDSDGNPVGRFNVTVFNASSDTATIVSEGIVQPSSGPPQVRRIRIPAKGNTSPSIFGPYGIQSTGNVIVNSNAGNDAYDASAGPYGVNGNSGLPSSIAAAGTVLLNSNARVGDVQAGGTVTINSNVRHGTIVSRTSPTPPIPFPDDDLAAAKASNSNGQMRIYKVTGQNKQLLQTGIPTNGVFNFNNLNAQRLRIEMPAGTYFLKNLQLNSNADIVVTTNTATGAPAGPVTLFMDPGAGGTAILMSSNTSINAEGWRLPTNGTSQQPYPLPSDFKIFIKQGSVTFNSQYQMYAGIFAPSSNMAIFNSNTELWGAVVAGSFTMNSNSNIHVDQSLLRPAGSSGYLAQCWSEIQR